MENVILIFSTSVSSRRDVKRVGSVLDGCRQVVRWNIDMEDWEKVLRIECDKKLEAAHISVLLKDVGIFIRELEYLETEKMQCQNNEYSF